MVDKTLVTAKVNPDLDGTSCTLAYADLLNQIGQRAEGIVFGSPQSEVQYFTEKHNIQIPTLLDGTQGNWNKFVLVDASSMRGMPQSVISEQVVEIIDHRKGEPEKEFPNAKIQNELIGAAATLIVERFIKANRKPVEDHAKLLYGAIYHNTLNFIASNTSDRDRDAASYLEKEFGLTPELAREMFDYATKVITKDVGQALRDDAKEFGAGFSIGAYQLIVWGSKVLKQKDQIEESISAMLQESGAEWGLLNIVDLESKRSILYCGNHKGQKQLESALNCNFTESWCELEKAWLRKQIMPLLSNL